MSLIIGSLLAWTFLDAPWRYLVIGGLVAIEAFEIMLWMRWRGVRARTGAESLVGARGHALSACRPGGQVKLKGQIWSATCRDGVDAGADVIVTAVDGVKLIVAPAGDRGPAPATGRLATPGP